MFFKIKMFKRKEEVFSTLEKEKNNRLVFYINKED